MLTYSGVVILVGTVCCGCCVGCGGRLGVSYNTGGASLGNGGGGEGARGFPAASGG